ncbi:MAG: S24 family peptidase [Neisseriaceae bacterium]
MQNKTLSENLTFLMSEYKIDDRALSKYTGVSFTTIARLRNSSGVNVTIDSLLPIAKFFNITVSQLIGEIELKKLHSEQNLIKSTNYKYVPVILWDDVLSNTVLDTYNTIYYIVTELDISEKNFAVTIPNNDYGAILKMGSILLIDREKNCSVDNMILINDGGQLFVCKIFSTNNAILLKPLNGLIGNLKYPSNKYTIIGNIVEIRYTLIDN